MGYQEGFKRIGHLAEAVGIREAIKAYEGCREIPGHCTFFCASRTTKLFDELWGTTPRLLACVGGDRCIVSRIAPFFFSDDMDMKLCGAEWKYSDYFEDLSKAVVLEAAKERPDLAAAARERTEKVFAEMVGETRAWFAHLRSECEEAWPILENYLREHGPTRHDALFKVEELKRFDLDNVLTELQNDGRIKAKYPNHLPKYSVA